MYKRGEICLENIKNFELIFKKILGEDEYVSLITEAVKEYKDGSRGNVNTDDIEVIIEYYCIAIFLIGISKKPIELDKYTICIRRNLAINIKTEDFCKKYNKYIEKVEEFKFDLLRELLHTKN